ncbi:cysteine desulfurase family protein [Paenibacillus apis]|uniref:Aminotransferase V n=1 Tax=Paenibacillus apis TaxID=1792174 RepID=A0A919Y1I7_9BACL|nr:cysteine desulfurase family protein [Paenibacillus apis]GIO40563.1 aminotransferase V [Paenibacillus apis]
MKYFDHAAATPPYEDVVRTVAEVMAAHYGNPSSLHKLGEESGRLLIKAREVCAAALGVKPGEIIFTSGATESNNLAVKGAAMRYAGRGRHLITTQVEHPSVWECYVQLEKQGWEVTFLPVDKNGQISVQDALDAVRKDTVLLSVMHVNNETGCIQPVEELGRRLKKEHPRVIFHVDGVQGFGKVPLSLMDSGIDLYSLSAHKLRGPRGAGLLMVREGLSLVPLMSGGGQEDSLRPGTENIPAVVGMAKAIRLAKEGEQQRAGKLNALRKQLIQGLAAWPELIVHSGEAAAPHIVHFSYPGMKAEAFLHMLEEQGFLVSTKSACSSKKAEPSRVLLAMGAGKAEAESGVRISLAEEHAAGDIQELLAAIGKSVDRVRRLKGEN